MLWISGLHKMKPPKVMFIGLVSPGEFIHIYTYIQYICMNIYPPKSSIEFTKSLLVSCLFVHYKTPIDPLSKLQGSPSPKWNSGSSSLQRWSMAFLSLHAVFSWDPWFVSWLPNNPRLEGISALITKPKITSRLHPTKRFLNFRDPNNTFSFGISSTAWEEECQQFSTAKFLKLIISYWTLRLVAMSRLNGLIGTSASSIKPVFPVKDKTFAARFFLKSLLEHHLLELFMQYWGLLKAKI